MTDVYEKGELFTPRVKWQCFNTLICYFRPQGIVEMNFETFQSGFCFVFCLFVCLFFKKLVMKWMDVEIRNADWMKRSFWKKKKEKLNLMIELYNDFCKSLIYPNMFQDSTCIYFSHLQHQKSRIQRKLFFQSSLQDPHEACYVLLSGDESCPVRAKTHHLDSQSLVCSRPSRGRNQPSRPVSFGTLSNLHRLSFGHNKHRRRRCCRGRWNRYRFSVYLLCRVQHSSCKL